MFTKNTAIKTLLIIALLCINLSPLQAATNFNTFPNLQLGSTNSFVKELQKILNSNGFPITTPGQPGSQNNETTKFGLLTQKALKSFQTKYNITPVTGNFASKTKAKLTELSKNNKLTEKVSKGTPVSYGTERCSSITQWEITWTFATSTSNPNLPLCGNFANGDWWVVGPVIVADIDPKGDVSGSMINPVPGNQHTQGFFSGVDPSINNYSASKNISLQLPYTISGNKSLYSTKGSPELWIGSPAEGKYFKETAILTVLDTVPASGSFRPPYAGTNKTIKSNWNVANLDYNKLRSLSIPNPAHVELNQSISYITWATQRPLLEMSYEADNSAWKAQWTEPKAGWFPGRSYGADQIGFISSNAGMQLNSNASNAAKEPLLINMVQWGIDNHGLLGAGMKWYPLGGHQLGRLLPTFIAGKVLNDSEILNRMKSNPSFQELANHHFINWNDVNTPRATRVPPPLKPFTVDMLGIPEFSANFPSPGDSAEWDSSSSSTLPYWGIPYRGSNGLANIGQVATILLMDGRADIDQEAFMRYHIERWVPLGGQVPQLTRDMWNAHIATDFSRIPGTMYTLTTTTTGTGQGYIDGQSDKYYNGTTASFTAHPLPGSVFAGWIGDCSGSTDCSITMNGNKSVTAVFNLTDSNYVIAAPVITSPVANNVQYSSDTRFVTVSWLAEPSGANVYNISTEEYLDASKTTKTISPARRFAGNTDNQYFGWQGYVFIQDYPYGRNITIPVEPGRYYDFTVTVFDRSTPTSYGAPQGPSATSQISFSIAADGQSVLDTDSDGIPNTLDKCPNTQVAYRSTVNTYGCPTPLLSTLKLLNNITTTDFTNITSLEVEDINSIFGKIRYTQPLNIFGSTDATSPINLDSYISIQDKKVIVNTTSATQFNKPATVTLYNVNMTRPQVMKDGVVYASSTSPNMSYDPVTKILTFSADGF